MNYVRWYQIMQVISQITKRCFCKSKINVLTSPIHESYQKSMGSVNAIFYLIHCPNGKTWNNSYRKLPKNHILIPKNKGIWLPPEIEIDVVLSQNRFDAYNTLAPIAQQFKIPLVTIEHTLAYPNWPPDYLAYMKSLKGDINVFISEYSRNIWGWKENEAIILHHGIDTNLFKPNKIKQEHRILTVVNDWINRDIPCGFRLWQEITKDLPVFPIGDTPGLSKPASNIDELVRFYQTSKVFLNTSLLSPIPTSLLEAMSCGIACVSTSTCMIPSIIKHGENGFISNNPKELRQYCIDLLDDEALRYRVGLAARKTIEEKFGLTKFIGAWNELLLKASQIRKN